MAAVLSSHSNTSSPPATSNPNVPQLPPLITSPPSRPPNSRAPSYANKRLSTFSNASSTSRSRPVSTVFPLFHSSLPYTLVRDFAYGPLHPLFYGPLPEQPSEISTPASEAHRRLSDPPPVWDNSRGGWSAGPWEPGEQLPQTSFGDGPPWEEDDDLHSPVVTSARHKKHKSHSSTLDFDHSRARRSRGSFDLDVSRRASYAGTNGDSNQSFYLGDIDETGGGPGSDYITYPPSSHQATPTISLPAGASRRDSHFAATLPSRRYANAEQQEGYLSPSADESAVISPTSSTSSRGSDDGWGVPHHHDDNDEDDDGYPADENRYSRDYQFTIASPDEEMHGKAVALFDFESENDNELPLFEGQIILVSYRHGQGWLVAQDPKTGESGLVPEAYVRLLKHIEGGWQGLVNGGHGEAASSGVGVDEGGGDAQTPTQAGMDGGEIGGSGGSVRALHRASGSKSSESGSGSGKEYTPVVSTFSTSRTDLERYPYAQQLRGEMSPEKGGFGGEQQRGGTSPERSKGKESLGR